MFIKDEAKIACRVSYDVIAIFKMAAVSYVGFGLV